MHADVGRSVAAASTGAAARCCRAPIDRLESGSLHLQSHGGPAGVRRYRMCCSTRRIERLRKRVRRCESGFSLALASDYTWCRCQPRRGLYAPHTYRRMVGQRVSVLDGHDEEEGGTWLGISDAALAALTNVRAPSERIRRHLRAERCTAALQRPSLRPAGSSRCC